MPRRTLVTGGSGFLGSFLCEKLLEKGHEVICVDNFYTGSSRNIAHLMNDPRFKLICHDITRELFVDCDEIYNLACPASPVHYQRDGVQTVRTCVHGAINMLDLATRLGVKILQSSTSEVYGDPKVHPQPECYWGNVNPVGARSCYDEAKRCAETLFLTYHMQYDLPTKIVRIFNTYGPKMHPDDGRVVSNLILQALRGEDLTVAGDGTQTRSFCYRDDMIDALILMMDSDKSVVGPVNLGNPAEFTILELAKLILEISNSKSQIKFIPLPPDDPKSRCPDITLAGKLLNWKPTTSLRSGLEKSIEYFDKLLAEEPEFCRSRL